MGLGRTAAVSAFILLAGVLGIVALMGSDAKGLDVPTKTVPVKSDPPGSPLTLRPLKPRQRRQARRILARDQRFRRIVDPHSYRFERLVPWGIQGREREIFIGTSMLVALTSPKPSVAAKWPFVDYFDDERSAYRVETWQLTVRGLRTVAVLVDLKRRKVAGLSPRKADEVIYPPGYKPPGPTGE